MKVRIIVQNMYIVEEVESIDEAVSILAQEIDPAYESLVKFENGLILSKEEVDEAH